MNIAVYLGSSFGTDPRIKIETQRLGEWMGKKHHKLVYGGGKEGLMGILASSVVENSGEVIGVELKMFCNDGHAFDHCSEFHAVDSFFERKKIIMDLSDAFIALPGGPGTLDEISEIICQDRFQSYHRPIFFLNIDGFYDDIKHQFEKMVAFGFFSSEEYENIYFVDDVDELIKEFKKY